MLVLEAELPLFVLESAPDEFLLSCTGAAGDAGATVAGQAPRQRAGRTQSRAGPAGAPGHPAPRGRTGAL